MGKKTRDELAGKHWVDLLVDRITEEKRPPFVITGGMTTSGPPHLGTVCEFLYPAVIKQALEDSGVDSELCFIGDILDAFDGVPLELEKYKSVLETELGKPLVYAVDPMDCHPSIGDHYLEQAELLMKALSLNINVLKVNELYDSGKFDSYARLYLKNEVEVKEIVASTSMKKAEELKEWSPIMPICDACGKIATTRVIWHDYETYEYVCDKDVGYTKGCGGSGKNKISDHKYKLQWRLHWPSWQAIFASSIEGSGVDHMTRGGSATTAYAVHKELLKREPPILYKYGFILVRGKKYSKSKGIGMGALDVLKLIPPEMLKYALIEPNIQQDKNIDPTGDSLIRLYEEVERVSRLEKAERRADEKKMLAFRLSIKKLPWEASFVDILLNYQIYKDWEKVGEKVNDKEGTRYLSRYIEEWLKVGYEPERYNFSVKPSKINELNDVVRDFNGKLEKGMKDIDVHNLVYSVAEDNDVEPDRLFSALYGALIGKDEGPRIGKLVLSIGIRKTKEILDYAAI